jgi:hypothetical protein
METSGLCCPPGIKDSNETEALAKESKCSSRRGCPARKHVERSLEDPSMLVVAYEEEQSHSKIAFQSPSMMLHI